MYAVIETGGKQYRVEVGTELAVELLEGAPGDALTIDRVLLIGDGADSAIGRPLVADATVTAEVVRQTRGEKLIAFKYQPKARRRVKKGHRQELTILRITDVKLGKRSAAEEGRVAEETAKTERQRLEEAAARQAAEDAALAAKLAARTPKAETADDAKEKAPSRRSKTKGKAAAEEPETEATAETEAKAGRRKARAAAEPEDATPAEEASRPAEGTEASASSAETDEAPGPVPASDEDTTPSDAPKRRRTTTKKDE
jgi:large subunit ribosomal protein L21